VTEIENEKYEVELGPFFTAGVLVLAYGLLRRRKLAIATGLGAIWVDQRTELGRSLKRRIRTAMNEQIKAHARSEKETPLEQADYADERT
jgi:hypothetical protein